MSNRSSREFDSSWILDARGPKNKVEVERPYLSLVEKELVRSGEIQDTGTVFLSNRECPFRCLMCDLWKNTTDNSISRFNVLQQIDFALERFRAKATISQSETGIQQLKLYNSGNFFDQKAIPREVLPEIANRVNGDPAGLKISNLIIENHPKLTGPNCLKFSQRVDCELEVAMGLETVHPEILPRLNKGMDLDDFCRATEFLVQNDIHVRAFILLRTPFMSESEGIQWALKSIQYAYSIGVNCCVLIPTRRGNGATDKLQEMGLFSEPEISSLETAMEVGLSYTADGQRLFSDLWDVERFSHCTSCFNDRFFRLQRMNFSQTVEPSIQCETCGK